jgi:hypothetical protein
MNVIIMITVTKDIVAHDGYDHDHGYGLWHI